MSIINQTLRELDARQIGPAASSPAPAAALRRRRSGLWTLAVVLLPIAGAVAWIVWTTIGKASPVLPRATQPVLSAPAQVAVVPAAAPPSVTTAPVVAPASPVEEPTAAALVPAPANADADARTVKSPPVPQRAPQVSMPVTFVGASPEPGNRITLKPETTLPATPAVESARPLIQHETRPPSGGEIADTYYRKALVELQTGRTEGTRLALLAVLDAAPAHAEARLALAALLSRSGQTAEAEALLRDGRVLTPDHPGLAMGLARLQAAHGDNAGAATTLLQIAGKSGVGAEYRATLAALLVQLDRPDDAARHYEQALRQQPGQGVWWTGLAISLEAQGKLAEARTAYQRALQTGVLPDDLAAFARAKAGK